MTYDLSRTDVAKVLDVVEECGDMWSDPVAWQHHLASWAEREVGGSCGFLLLIDARSALKGLRARGPRETKPDSIVVLDATLGTSSDDSARTLIEAWIADRAYRYTPGQSEIRDALAEGKSISVGHSGTANVRGYERYGCQYLTPVGIYHTAGGAALCPDGTHLAVLMGRSQSERAFAQHELGLLRAAVESVAARCGTRLSTSAHKGLHRLARRERQTLQALLEGDSEKQIAVRLGISASTVHEHVGTLYRYFGAHSRSELMALFVSRRPQVDASLKPGKSTRLASHRD